MLLDVWAERETAVEPKRLYGVYAAQVTDIKDPDGQGRVKVRLPWTPDDGGGYEVWARLATLMGGNKRGTWFIPDQNDEVLVVFEGGDPRHPYVVGGLWNGKDAPPESMDGSGRNNKKVVCSRNGVRVELNDEDGQESLTLKTPGGQQVVLKDGAASIELTDSNGNTVKCEASGITISTSSKLTISASTIDVTASMVKVSSGMSQFSGVVQCDTLITNSVVSSSYTPGAGNIW